MTTLRQNRRTRNRTTRERQRGVALIAAMLTLVLIAAITAGMIILSTTETNISANFRDEQKAFFGAKAGIEEVRDRLRKNTAPATDSLRGAGILPVNLPGTTANGASVLYILNPLNGETVAPWNGSSLTSYPDTEICQENNTVPCATNTSVNLSLPSASSCTGWCQSLTASTTYALSPVSSWKWVRVTLKQNNQFNGISASLNTNGANTALVDCWHDTYEFADSGYSPTTGCTAPYLPVYVLTALAVTPQGTRRMVQTELAEDIFPFTTPSTLTMDGNLDVFNGGSSNQWGVNGNDQPGCGVSTVGAPVHAIGTIDNGDIATIDAGINRPSNITGSGSTTPDVANVSSTLPPNLSSVSQLQTLVSQLKNDATQPVINGIPTAATSLSNPGTAANPQIIYVNGSLTLSGNTQGYGILVVTGTLTISGTVGWNGIVLVVGQGVFNTDGTDQYNGAIVVANTLNSLGQPLTTLGPAQVNVNGGGHGGFQYSSGCIAQATTLSTFHVNAIRELMR